jgi:glycosyltransferase involved in cell wall biosynthesis
MQKTSDVRLYVIDGGSSDSTLDLIHSFEAHIDFWYSAKDAGVYDAMNKAVANIKFGWILFLGADDRIMPNTLLRLCETLRQTPQADTMFYGDVYRPSLNKLYDGKFSVYKLMRRNICQQSILYPCKVLKKYPFDISFRINADHILNIQLFFDREITKHYIPICISYYEDISSGISRNTCDAHLLASRRKLALNLGGITPYLFAIAIDVKEWLRRRICYLIP